LDKTQFIIAIVTNIVAAIIIWLATRLVRGTIKAFTSGTTQAKVKAIFTVKRITILGSFAAALFNLWVLVNFLRGHSAFTLFELLVSITLSLIIYFWTNRLIAVFRTPMHQQLEATRKELGGARAKIERLEEAQKHTAKLSRRVEEEARKRAETENLVDVLRQAQNPRMIFWDEFRNALNGKTIGVASILYQQGDPEAYRFAMDLYMALASSEWLTNLPEAVSSVMDVKGFSGVTIVVNKIESQPFEIETAQSALRQAILTCAHGVRVTLDETLPDGFFRIVVGPKENPILIKP
jgi:hypothetical protein